MLRMYLDDFDQLLRAVSPLIEKHDTVFRNLVRADKRLSITLRYLVTGNTAVPLAGVFCVSQRSVRRIIPETCLAISPETIYQNTIIKQ